MVMEVEDDVLGWDKSRRVRVMPDVTKPILRVYSIRNKRGMITSLQFKYERLSMFCFLCGKLGHMDRDCPMDPKEEAHEINNGGCSYVHLHGKGGPK